MIWHSATLGEVLVELESDPDKGLNDVAVLQKQKTYGLNFTSAIQAAPLRRRLAEAFRRPVCITLLLAALLSGGVNVLNHVEAPFLVPAILMGLYALQILCTVLRDAVCVRSVGRLKLRVYPSARVLRGGVERIVNATDLVPGDILLLKKGDLIPADARLIDAHRLICDESVLSGHFVPVAKSAGAVCEDHTPLTERANIVHSGCVVSYGEGKAVVIATGAQTETGKLTAVEEARELSAANRGLAGFAATLRKFLPLIFVVIFAADFLFMRFTGDTTDQHLLVIGANALLFAAALTASLSPDGFSSMATLILTLGMSRMKRRGAIVTDPVALDKLSKVDVVCADKAALTEQQLAVAKLAVGEQVLPLPDLPDEGAARLLRYAALCADDGDDPTDEALIRAYRAGMGIDKSELENLYPRLSGLPFDAKRGIMATVNMIHCDTYVIVKGAPEEILAHCPEEGRAAFLSMADGMGSEALHVIAVAVKPLNDPALAASPTADGLLCDLTCEGLIGFINPVREDAAEAVRLCKAGGTRPVMITGDGLATSVAVARQIGILDDETQALTGEQLRQMDDLQLQDKIDDYTVFARITPEDKIRLVAALQGAGHVVAITGRNPIDSVALKAADVGLAMGMTGTDAARTAADLVLGDDSFSTIVAVINRASTMFECIRKGLHFTLACDMALGLIGLIGLLIWHLPVLAPAQMLAASLLFSLLVPLAIGMEPVHRRKASAAKLHVDSFFEGGRRLQVLWHGTVITLVTGLAYAIGAGESTALAGAMAYLVFGAAALIYSFSLRSRNPVVKLGLLGNPYMIGCILLGAALLALSLNAPLLGLDAALTARVWWAVPLCFFPLLAAEAVKLLTGNRKEKNR